MPDPERKVHISMDSRGTVRLIGRVSSAQKLLKQVGALIASDAKRAFQDQSFAGIPWPHKYPNQSEPFISIAGIVQDFTEGRKAPMPETLQRTPALHRTGELSRSISFSVLGLDTVEIGSVVPYASLQQTGGLSTQPVSKDVKDKISGWLGKAKKHRIFAPDYIEYNDFKKWVKAKGFHFKGNASKKRSKSGYETVSTNPNDVYRSKLAFLLRPSMTQLETQVHARPYLGITEQRAERIAEMLADHLASGGA